MKKIIALIFSFIILSTCGAAISMALDKGTDTSDLNVKFAKLVDGNVFRVEKNAGDTTLKYGGQTIFIPMGSQVVFGRAKDNSIVISGDRIYGVRIGGYTITAISSGETVLSFNVETNILTPIEGTFSILGANGQESQISSTMADVQAPVEAPIFVEMASKAGSMAATQAIEDYEASIVLSPSAPTYI